MKVLIIGGMGVIGGAISKAAINKGLEVFIVSRRSLFGEWKSLNVHLIQGDWLDNGFANLAVTTGFDVIVDTQIFTEKQLIRSLNIANHHCKQFIYISTDSVYVHPAENISEDEPIDLYKLKWKYGFDKRLAELYLIENSHKYSFAWSVIRPTITFGNTRIPVGYSTKRDTYTIANRIVAGKPIIVFDEPGTKHAVCHVSIFGSATVELFLNSEAYGQFYHISDDYNYTYSEIFSAIEKVLGVKGKYVYADTEILKRYSKSSYEEMIYDKNPTFTLDNGKIKLMAPNVNFHVEMEDVMRDILSYLKDVNKEDEEYNLISDCILMKMGRGEESFDGKKEVQEYIRGFNKEYLMQLDQFERKVFMKNVFRVVKDVLRPIKSFLILNKK